MIGGNSNIHRQINMREEDHLHNHDWGKVLGNGPYLLYFHKTT